MEVSLPERESWKLQRKLKKSRDRADKELSLKCNLLPELPKEIGKLKTLRRLCINCVRIRRLPETLGRLQNLTYLEIKACHCLTSLPDQIVTLNLQNLQVVWCDGLESLPTGLGNLKSLEILHLEDLRRLESLPVSVGDLTSLQTLQICRCQGLLTIPESIGELPLLHDLSIRHCENLQSLPQSLGNLQQLKSLVIWREVNPLPSIPESMWGLQSLKVLTLGLRWPIEDLPTSIQQLTNLYALKLDRYGIFYPEVLSLSLPPRLRQVYLTGLDEWCDIHEEKAIEFLKRNPYLKKVGRVQGARLRDILFLNSFRPILSSDHPPSFQSADLLVILAVVSTKSSASKCSKASVMFCILRSQPPSLWSGSATVATKSADVPSKHSFRTRQKRHSF